MKRRSKNGRIDVPVEEAVKRVRTELPELERLLGVFVTMRRGRCVSPSTSSRTVTMALRGGLPDCSPKAAAAIAAPAIRTVAPFRRRSFPATYSSRFPSRDNSHQSVANITTNTAAPWKNLVRRDFD